MSEHTATVPQFLQCQGCKEANRSLIAGKLDWYSYSSLRNTANSITPVGEINLRRAKTMPRRETVIATMAHPSKTAARSTLARPNRRRSAGTLHSALKIFTVLLGVILLLQLIGPPILDQVVSSPSGLRFLSGSRENSVSTEWDLVIIKFLSTVRPIHFRTDKIESAFKENSSSPFVLLTLNSGVPSINVDNLHPMYKRHGRCSSVEYIIRNITSNPDFPPLNLTALIDVSDGEAPTVATFSSARHWHSWKDVIPMPLGNRNGWRAGKATPIESWDTYINENVVKTHANFPWSTKENKAVFRGSLRMCDHVLGSCNWENGARCQNSERWDECNRGVLYKRVWRIRQYFDVAFTRWVLRPDRNFHQVDGAPAAVEEIPFADFQKYKLILNVGAINDWDERLRSLMFMNSAIVHHLSESQQFFTPLLKPWTHVIPTSVNMSDLVKNVQHALAHERATRKIIAEQNRFARRYLTEAAMLEYWSIALVQFARQQHHADKRQHYIA